MKKLVLWTVTCLWASILLAAATYQPLNVKMGQWQTTWTTTVSGLPPVSQDMLDRMSPEQRARAEAAMKNMASGRPMTRVAKTCLTKEQLQKDPFNDMKSCKETVLASTSSRMEVHEVCNQENMIIDARVRIEALDTENVKGTVQSTASGSGRTMNVNGTFTSKWLGAACKEKDNN